LTLCAIAATAQQPDGEPALPPGVEPLTRGPIHEAFAQPEESGPKPSPIVPKQPPAPIDEVPPDQQPAGDNVQWIPGYWAWDDERADFIWVSGFWRDVPPQHAWVPGYWAQVEGGWQWVPGYWADAQQNEQELLPPPPAPIDMGPSTPPPNDQSSYIPGIWVYRGNQYAWRPGFWLPMQQNWTYCPARYQWTPAGYLFNEGYWDYPLQNRGLLYAPVALGNGIYNQPGWSYTPSYAVPPSSLLSALFVRPLTNHYYFGNYYNPGYARAGYVPWVDYHPLRGVSSPLVRYENWRHGGSWLNEQRQQYVLRREGKAALPPSTWHEQRGHAVTIVAPATRLGKEVPLHQITPARLAEERKSVAHLRTAAKERHEVITQHAKAGPRPATAPHAKVALPHVNAPARTPAPAALQRKVAVPAHPALPQHVARPAPAPRAPAAPHRFEAHPAVHVAPHVEQKKAARPPEPVHKVEEKAVPRPAPAPRPKVEEKAPPHPAPAPRPKVEEKKAPPPKPAPPKVEEKKKNAAAALPAVRPAPAPLHIAAAPLLAARLDSDLQMDRQ
jgi:hypothetical protein